MRVLLADDQDNVRSALRLVIDHEPDCKVIGEVKTSDRLLMKIDEHKPDLLIIDWELQPYGRWALIKKLQNQYPHMYVIAMSACILVKQEAIAAGADAFVSKVEPVEKFILTLRNLADLQKVKI